MIATQAQNSTIENVWQNLLSGIEEIYNLRPITRESYMQLYNLIYNYCQDYNNAQARGQVAGEELYMKIKEYLINHTTKILNNSKDVQNDSIIRFYAQQWNQYQSSSKVLNAICLYLNMHWIRRNINNTKIKDVYEIFHLTLELWKRIIFEPLYQRVTDACLNLVQTERNGKIIDTNLISLTMQNYVVLSSKLEFYKNHFEKPFLKATEDFYVNLANSFLQNNSVVEYLKKVEQSLNEEIHRVHSYLHVSTSKPLIQLLENILIRDRLEFIYSIVEILLSNERDEDLILLYELVDRIPNAFIRLKDTVENHIIKTGVNAIGSFPEQTEIATKHCETYIETMINMCKRFSQLIQQVFNNRQEFIIVLNNGCAKFINNNHVTTGAGGSQKIAESLARYSDIILQKKGVQDNKIDDILLIFNYLHDKDVFEKFYNRYLGKRLLGHSSASDENEKLIVTKLENLCGREYTSKIQVMLKDYTLSQDLTKQYKASHREQIEYSIMVLTSNSWTLSVASPVLQLTEIQSINERFSTFYNERHQGRKLTWLDQHSNGELFANFTSRRYILQISTYQTIVLFLFNERTSWSVEEIMDRTNIQKELLSQVLIHLLKVKLLNSNEITVNENDIQLNYQINLTEDFTSEKTRINLNVPFKSIEKKDNENTQRRIRDDRKYVIEAAIVRIMKARKELQYTLLIDEIIQQLKSRFPPNIPDIKKCIENLIEKAYIERDDQDKNLIKYLA